MQLKFSKKTHNVFTLSLSSDVISSRKSRYHHSFEGTIGFKIGPQKLATHNKRALFININQFQEWQLLTER